MSLAKSSPKPHPHLPVKLFGMPAFTTIARSKLKQPHNDIFLHPLLPTLAVGMTLGTVLQMMVDFENVNMDR